MDEVSFADQVVAAGRRACRRRLVMLTAAGLVVALAIAVPVLADGSANARGAAARPASAASTSDRARIYAAARAYLGDPEIVYGRETGLVRLGDRAVVVFGPLEVSGARATLAVEQLCGPLCGVGRTLVLSRNTADQWSVIAAPRPDWVNWGVSRPPASSDRASSSSTTGRGSASSSARARRSPPR